MPTKGLTEFVLKKLVAGLLVIAPIYLAALLLLRAASSLMGLVKPFAMLLPRWMPGAEALSLLIVLVLCFVVGVSVSTAVGHATWERLENALFQKIPGYALLRSLTQQLAGRARDNTWKPALAEIEEALVPAFIVEELEDGSFTVFVPSVPTPLAGSVYILTPERVHPLNISFTQAIKAVSRWGSGCKDLVAAREDRKGSAVAHDIIHSTVDQAANAAEEMAVRRTG